MARTKEQKKEIVGKLEKIMDDSTTLVFVKVHGLKVAEATAMRRDLSKEGIGFYVAKKTLIDRALSGRKYTGTEPALPGEIGLAYGKDEIGPARSVYGFEKKLKDQVSIMGGVFGGKYEDKDAMTQIASIPPLQTLYGMFANVINSPIQGLVSVLDQAARKKQS